MTTEKRTIEVCFTPALFEYYKNEESIVVIVDILRATSTICTAFYNGLNELIPVSGIEEAREYKKKGYIIAAERDGTILDFADIGNSPEHFSPEIVKGKTIVYSTTNGTQAINMASGCNQVVIGSFLNLDLLAKWLYEQNKNVIILCSGWKKKFNLEDSVFAGALSSALLKTERFTTQCDSAHASIDLWEAAKENILSYMEKASHKNRLKKLHIDHVLPYCFSLNKAPVLPILSGKIIVSAFQT